MSEEVKKTVIPRVRFPEFLGMPAWNEHVIEEYLTESRVKGSKGDVAKKITVKLWGKGVYEKNDEIKGSVNTQYYRRLEGQFIYSKLDFLNQAFGIIPQNLDGYESTVDLPCFDISEGISPIYLLEYVKRKEFYERLGETADGSRKAKRIHADTFLSFPIFMPSVEEQQKIADCLFSIDQLITAQAQKLDTLKAHKKGLMQQLFPAEGETVPKLRFPEFRDAGDWDVKQLKLICQMQAGKFVSASEINEKPGEGLYSCYGGNGLRGYTNTHTHTGKYSLIGRQGALCGNVKLVTGKFHATEHAVVATPLGDTSTDWLFYELTSLNLNQYATGQAQPGLSVKTLEELSIKIPEQETEQQKIAACLTSIDQLITAQAQKIDTLKAHKKGLMQQLFPSSDEVNG